MDNLPAATVYTTDLGQNKMQLGIPIGYLDDQVLMVMMHTQSTLTQYFAQNMYLYNHVVFTIKVHPSANGYVAWHG